MDDNKSITIVVSVLIICIAILLTTLVVCYFANERAFAEKGLIQKESERNGVIWVIPETKGAKP
jgi:hypothetical protein